MSFDWQELIGYFGSALVVTSLTMTSVVRLRTVSLAGSMTFLVYGSLIGSIPIIITNGAIACINVWFLARELGGGRDLGAVVVPPDSPFLVDFLANHEAEITTFQPGFDADTTRDFALVLTRDGLPAGAVLGRRTGPHLDIDLDYVMRAYQDSRLGQWLFGPGARTFRSAGIATVASDGGTPSHQAYLERVGFEFDAATDSYVRAV